MLLDNENQNLKVHEWIARYTEEGNLNIVTGYFTVGALAYLSRTVNKKIKDYRFVLGDIVNVDAVKDRTLDLINENITVDAALRLDKLAQEAVEFLKQDNVNARTLEPNFCHAKVYLFKPAANDDRDNYFISGSSNLTEAGIGLKETHNIELNIAETGNNNQYKELAEWFEGLWISKQAHKDKTLIDETGKKYTKPFKEHLIEEIEKIFIKYSPKELYYKVLFELFGSQIDSAHDNPGFNRQIGRLENTAILNTKLISFWFSKNYNSLSMAGGYFNVGTNEINSIPVPENAFADYWRSLSFLTEVNQYLNRVESTNITLFINILNALVVELYFENETYESKLDILKFVEQDLKEVLGKDNFEQLPDKRKEAVIEELHKRWSNPASEIVKRMNSFTEKSPDILKSILESK